MDALDALAARRIPKDWLAKSWEGASLGGWFAGLLGRHDQLARWLCSGRPKAYWLTGFFNPQVSFIIPFMSLATHSLDCTASLHSKHCRLLAMQFKQCF